MVGWSLTVLSTQLGKAYSFLYSFVRDVSKYAHKHLLVKAASRVDESARWLVRELAIHRLAYLPLPLPSSSAFEIRPGRPFGWSVISVLRISLTPVSTDSCPRIRPVFPWKHSTMMQTLLLPGDDSIDWWHGRKRTEVSNGYGSVSWSTCSYVLSVHMAELPVIDCHTVRNTFHAGTCRLQSYLPCIFYIY